MKVIEALSAEDYGAVLGAVCPYCAAGLPVQQGQFGEVRHVILLTVDSFRCEAARLRVLRGEVIPTAAEVMAAQLRAEAASGS